MNPGGDGDEEQHVNIQKTTTTWRDAEKWNYDDEGMEEKRRGNLNIHILFKRS